MPLQGYAQYVDEVKGQGHEPILAMQAIDHTQALQHYNDQRLERLNLCSGTDDIRTIMPGISLMKETYPILVQTTSRHHNLASGYLFNPFLPMVQTTPRHPAMYSVTNYALSTFHTQVTQPTDGIISASAKEILTK